MAMIGMLIVFAAGLAAMVFGIQLLILNFQENVLWGLASLFFGLPSLLFVVLRWDKAGPPFLKQLACLLVAGVGFAIASLGS